MFWVFCACTGSSVADCVLPSCAFDVSAVVFVGFVVLAVFVVSVEVVVVAVSPLSGAIVVTAA